MATVTDQPPAATGAASARPAAAWAGAGGLADWVVVVLCSGVVAGGYLDAWAHSHLALPDSFLTPWHGLLYGAMMATTACLTLLRRRRRAAGMAWEWTSGYGLALTGCALFAASGVTDGLWHSVLGFETGLNGLVSPPHVLLVLSGGLVVSGPLRVAWSRGGARAPWPAVISAALVLSLLTYLTQFDHPLSTPWAAEPAPLPVLRLRVDAMELGVLGMLFQVGVLTAVVLLLMVRFRLPTGALTLVLGLNGVLVTAVERLGLLTLVAIATGAVGDLLLPALRPSLASPRRLRLFAALLPAAVCLLYFAALLLAGGVWWPLHLWTGTVLLAAAEGWLLSFLVLPPAPVTAGPRG